MGCGLSTRLNPEDAATLSHGRMMSGSDRHITDINSPATSKHHDRGGGDSVLSFAQWSQKSGSSTQGKDAKHVGEGGEKEEGEKEEEDYQSEVLIFPRSPSFRVYCIASSNSSRSHSFISDSFHDNDSASSVKNNGDEDSTNKPTEEKKERKKKERRTRGLRSVLQKGMPRRKKNLLNFGCYTSHASYDEKPL